MPAHFIRTKSIWWCHCPLSDTKPERDLSPPPAPTTTHHCIQVVCITGTTCYRPSPLTTGEKNCQNTIVMFLVMQQNSICVKNLYYRHWKQELVTFCKLLTVIELNNSQHLLWSYIDRTCNCMDSTKQTCFTVHRYTYHMNTKLMESFTMRNRPESKWRASVVYGHIPGSTHTLLEYKHDICAYCTSQSDISLAVVRLSRLTLPWVLNMVVI